MEYVRFEQFLSAEDAAKTIRALQRLANHGFHGFALTGGLAVEAQLAYQGEPQFHRHFNDVDLIVEGFGAIPKGLSDDFLVQPISASGPDDQSLVQLTDLEQAVRVDVFEQAPEVLGRSRAIVLDKTGAIRVDSIEDLAARAASLTMGLARDTPVPRKHLRDHQRLARWTEPDTAEVAWQHHRKQGDPATFRDARAQIPGLVESRGHLLMESLAEGARPVTSLVCCFCGRAGDELGKVVGNPAGVLICQQCIALGRKALLTRTAQVNRFVRLEPVARGKGERCSFCGRPANQRHFFRARAKSTVMCNECLDIAELTIKSNSYSAYHAV